MFEKILAALRTTHAALREAEPHARALAQLAAPLLRPHTYPRLPDPPHAPEAHPTAAEEITDATGRVVGRIWPR